MKAIYDLLAYSFAPHGGIARLTDEMFKAFGDNPRFEGLLYSPFPLQRQLPRAPRLRHLNLPALPKALSPLQPLHRAAESTYYRKVKADLFHPTFYPMHTHFDHLPLVITAHDFIHEKVANADDMPNHDEFLARKARYIRKAGRIIAISQATRDDLLDLYEVDPARVTVAPLAGDPYFHLMSPEASGAVASEVLHDVERPFLLYVGSRQRYKNFEGLVRSFSTWTGRKEHALVVVGGPTNHEDHRLLTEHGVQPEEVLFTGHLEDDQLCALYNRAAAFVYPSFAEGFGIPLLEAMASGCPTCISDIPPFREVAGDLAVYFDPHQDESLHQALTRAVAMRDDRSYIPAFRKRAADFTWGRFTRTVWDVYEDLLNHG